MKLKQWISVLALALVAVAPLRAETTQALMNSSTDDWSFFFKPDFEASQVAKKSAQFIGAELGSALGHQLYLGLGAYGLINNVNLEVPDYQNMGAFDIWYAGLMSDYTFSHTRLFHGSMALFLGGGQVKLSKTILIPGTYTQTDLEGNIITVDADVPTQEAETSNVFVAKPGLNFMLNLTENLELGLGVGYRFMNGVTSDAVANNDMSSWTGTLFIRWTED